MAEHNHPFFKVAEDMAYKLTELRHDAEKAAKTNWDEAFSTMAQVRRRLEQASSNEERKAIRLQIEGMKDSDTKMRQLLAGYRSKPKGKSNGLT